MRTGILTMLAALALAGGCADTPMRSEPDMARETRELAGLGGIPSGRAAVVTGLEAE